MKIPRREFITLVGGAAVAWPLVARAQQGERMRRIGVLMSNAADDPLGQVWTKAFTEGLRQLGWEVGRNMRIDYRWGAGDTDRFRSYASELVASAPDAILANAGSIVAALEHASRTVPIVFVTTIDPVGSGLVASLARPGGNATGFTPFEFSLSAKLLEMLRTMVPDVKRVAVLRDPAVPAGPGGFAAVQTVAPSLGVELTPIGVHNADEVERGIAEFARGSNGGLVVVGPPSSMQWGANLIVRLAAQYGLPAVYATLTFVTAGGLISYGADATDEYRRAASYVDRVLKGEKPADLPVQAPTRYQLVINLKTAKALGLNVPSMLLATADKVIE